MALVSLCVLKGECHTYLTYVTSLAMVDMNACVVVYCMAERRKTILIANIGKQHCLSAD